LDNLKASEEEVRLAS